MNKRNRFFKVSNGIFNFRLKPSAFYLYIYLANTFYWKKSVRIKLSTLSKNCAMSVNTVRAALSQLEEVFLIKKIRHKHIRSGYTTTSEYEIRRIGGKFSMLDKAMFELLKEDKGAAMVLCAVSSYQNSHNRAFPSYSQLTELTGLSRSTVTVKINVLNATGALCRERYVCLSGVYGHNNYATVSVKERFFLFIYILSRFGRYVILFEADEYYLNGRGKTTHYRRTIFWVYIYHRSDRLLSSMKRKFFVDPSGGSPKIDKPIIDPLKLRKKIGSKVK